MHTKHPMNIIFIVFVLFGIPMLESICIDSIVGL